MMLENQSFGYNIGLDSHSLLIEYVSTTPFMHQVINHGIISFGSVELSSISQCATTETTPCIYRSSLITWLLLLLINDLADMGGQKYGFGVDNDDKTVWCMSSNRLGQSLIGELTFLINAHTKFNCCQIPSMENAIWPKCSHMVNLHIGHPFCLWLSKFVVNVSRFKIQILANEPFGKGFY